MTTRKIYELVVRVPAAGDALGQELSDLDAAADPRVAQRVRDAAALRALHRRLHESGQSCLLAAILVEQGRIDLHHAEDNEVLFASAMLGEAGATPFPFLIEIGYETDAGWRRGEEP